MILQLEKGLQRVAGTSRASQRREYAIREARLREPILELLGRLEALFRPDLLQEWRQAPGTLPDLEELLRPWDQELERRREQLAQALVGPGLTKDAFDDYATPLGPLTTKTLADNQIGDLIRGTLGQRAQVRRALRELFAYGPTESILASIGSTVGLTERMQNAVYRRRDKLLEAGASAAEAARESKAYGRRLKAYRARLIARTESVRFTSMIVEETARQAGPGYVKQWVSARDVDVEATCEALDNGEKVPIDTNFSASGGGHGRPPAHPGCRCVLEIYQEKPKPKPVKKPKPRKKPAPKPPVSIVPKKPRKKPKPRKRPIGAGDARTAEEVAAELEALGMSTDKQVAAARAVFDQARDELEKLAAKLSGPIKPGTLDAAIREYNTVVDKVQKANNALDAVLEERFAKFLPVLERAGADRAGWATFWAPKGGSAKTFTRGDDVFRRLIHRRQTENYQAAGKQWQLGIKLNRSSGDRAQYKGLTKRTGTPKGPFFGTIYGPQVDIPHNRSIFRQVMAIAHELGHGLEDQSQAILAASKKFLQARTAGETATNMAKLFPGRGYHYSEIVLPDLFRSPYVGKVYKDATEVVSMGLEYMVEDALAFWREDPEHFRFIWDIMRGAIP